MKNRASLFRRLRYALLILLGLCIFALGVSIWFVATHLEIDRTSKDEAARILIGELSQSLDLFKLENGRYPTQGEGLWALIIAPQGLNSWKGPYWKENKIPKDPWNNEFKYVTPGKNGAPYEVISSGRDGKEISSADL